MKRDLVEKTLKHTNVDRIPMVYFNRDKEKSDLIMIDVSHHFTGSQKNISEWGFKWDRCDETMGQPSEGILKNIEDIKAYEPPKACDRKRFADVKAQMDKYSGAYYLASFGLSGFTTICCLRGFTGVLEDLYIDEKAFELLEDKVFGTEEEIIKQLKQYGFHGVAFFDDWGTQNNMIISPDKWRQAFKPRYKRQFELVHSMGMDVYFHSCGAIGAIIGDLIEIGVDMLNISQPNLFDIEDLGRKYGGKVCFVCPVSYQTTSISGTKENIYEEIRKLVHFLGCFNGGLIGYIEDYSIMGMSEENYQACIYGFETIGDYKA